MKTVILLFIILLPLTSFTQRKASYKVGVPYKYIEAPTSYKFQNEEQTKTLTIKLENGYIYFQMFDNRTLSEVRIKKVKLNDKIPKYSKIIGISKLGEKIYCFYFHRNPDNKKWVIKCRNIDFFSCSFSGKEKTVLETDKYLASFWEFQSLISSDDSKIMFYWRHQPKNFKDKVNYDVFTLSVFDHELNNIKTSSVTMPYTEKKMDNIQFLIQNNGTPYMLALVFNDDTRNKKKKDKKKVVANYHYELFQINLSSKSILRTKITLGKTLITDCYISAGKDNSILASGFYTKKIKENLRVPIGFQGPKASVDGMCLFRIDDIGLILSEKKFEIPNEIVNQYENSSNKSENDSELSNLKMRRIISQDDGSTIIIAEQIYISSSSGVSFSNNSQTVNSDEHYHLDDIIICKLNSKDAISWIKKLPKRQKGTNRYEDLSFSYQNFNNNHYIIFLDNIKNIDLPLDQKPAIHSSGKGGYLTYYRIPDDSGKLSKHSIFSTKSVPVKGRKSPYSLYFFKPNEVIKTSESTFMVEFYKRFKEDVMVQVKVE